MSANNETEPISLTGDICENGAITVIIAIVVVFLVAGIKIALDNASPPSSANAAAPRVRRLAKGSWLENVLVLPFVPTSLENFVLAIYFTWFCFTITMGVTRYYEKRWADDVIAQQGPFNVIAEFIGCKGLDPAVIPYQWQEPEPSTKRKGFRFPGTGPKKSPLEKICQDNPLECSSDIDFYFSHHLAFGIVWLSFGALQIYMARSGWSHDPKVRRKAHKLFGTFVALPAFFCHIIMASRIAWRNPVNQVRYISVQYFAMIFESLLLAANGIWFAMEGNHGMHIVRMFFTWIQSVVGSGSIRLTAWILWLIGKFFSMETRVLIDRGACQGMAIHGYNGNPPTITGSAEYCFKSVFLNLMITDAVILWLEWIFLCLPIVKWNRADRAATMAKFKTVMLLTIVYILMVFVFNSPDWLIQIIMGAWAFFVKMHTFRMYIASFLHDPTIEAQPAETRWDTTKRYVKTGLLNLYLIQEPDDSSDNENDEVHEHIE